MRKRLKLIAAICIACWFAIAVFPVAGYNSINVSSETDLSLNISEPDNIQAYPEQEICQNCSDNISVLSQNLTNISLSDTVDYSHYSCQSHLWVVDYWGNHYPCNSRCIFLKDMAKMIISPCKTGYLKLYEKYPDQNIAQSRYIPVYANKRYSWWFVGDIEGVHTLWFTLTDLRRQVLRSNDATFRVIVDNCSPTANCSPSSWV